MSITRENIDELNAVLKVKIVKDDYEARVTELLKDHSKKAQMPGFRPGKVPFGLIKKMYGTSVLVEEVNKLISESLTKYITDEKINILGEPLPKEGQMIDWETQTDFELDFEIGLSPEVEVKLTKKDKVVYYNIAVDDKLKENYVKNYTRRFGNFEIADVVEEDEMLIGNLNQADDKGNVLEEGISKEQSTLSLNILKDKEIKDLFKGAKLNDIVTFDVKKAFPNDTEIASLIGIEKEEVAAIEPNFQFTITEIKRFIEHELNQDLFDQVYGKDTVKTVKEFEAKVVEEIKENFAKDSDYRLVIDTRDKLVSKFNPQLPEEFLKRWLFEINKEKFTLEDIEKDFPSFVKDLQWQIIKNTIIKEQDIKVEQEEVQASAKTYALMQFQQYGMFDMPEEQLEGYANEILKNQEEANKLYEKIFEDKVVDYVKELIKIDEKEIALDDFNKLFEQK